MKSTLSAFFDGLQLSLLHFFGMAIGAALTLPITLKYSGQIFDRNSGQTVFFGILLGLYTISIVIIGTWTSLGLLGRWAGRIGGRGLRLCVQIIGITMAAWLTLPLAIVVTLVLMAIVGNYVEDRKSEPLQNEKLPVDGQK